MTQKIAGYLTSFSAVLTGLLLLLGFMIFETQSLFERILPMSSWKATMASILIAIVYEFSILIFTVNADKISKRIPIVLSVISFLFNLWFWEVWTGEMIIRIMKIVVSGVLAYLNYAYCELFFSLYIQRNPRVHFSTSKKPSNKADVEIHLTCPTCGKGFRSKAGITTHIRFCKQKYR